MNVEVYAGDIIIIHNDRFGLDFSEQTQLLEWFWKYKPELVVKSMTLQKERFEQFCNVEAEALQRHELRWLVINKPELIKEFYEAHLK